MNDVLLVFFGWLLGLLGPGIVERIRRKQRAQDLVDSVVAELLELQYTLVAVAFKLRSHLATASDEFFDWALPIMRSYEGPSKSPTLVDTLTKSREFPEEQRRTADIAGRDANIAIALKRYDVPFLATQGSELSICALDFQRRVFRAKGQLDLFNQHVGFLQGQFDRTFESGITTQNRDNIDRNLESGYAKLANEAQSLARAISDIVHRYGGTV